RARLHVLDGKRLELLVLPLADVLFELVNACRVVCSDRGVRQCREAIARGAIAGIQLERLAVRGRSAGGVALPLEHRSEIAVGFGRFRAEIDRMTEAGGGLVEIAAVQRGAAFGEIQRRILAAIRCRHELTALLQW